MSYEETLTLTEATSVQALQLSAKLRPTVAAWAEANCAGPHLTSAGNKGALVVVEGEFEDDATLFKLRLSGARS